jgi:hypothetical protein
MKLVKGRYAVLLRTLGEIFTQPPHKALDYGELGALLGVTEEAVKTWARRGISAEGRLALLTAAEERGPTVATRVKNLLQGGKMPPSAGQDDESTGGLVLEPFGGRGDGVKQRESALRALNRALQAEELHGPALERALWRIAEDFEGLGHRQAANEIWRELAHMQGKTLDELRKHRKG